MTRIPVLITTFILVSLACTLSADQTPTPEQTLPTPTQLTNTAEQPVSPEPLPDSAEQPVPPEPLPDSVELPVPPEQPQSEKRCGDEVCDGPETAQTCPQDCDIEEEPQPDASSQEYWVRNPNSGAQLYVHVTTPDNGEGPFPALVLVPGGVGDSNDMLSKGIPGRLADSGFVVVIFDPDGRGKSDGVEDYNGFIHQDGLAAVIRFAAALPQVDAANIGMVSFSYGVTMASGTLARHPDLPVIFYIDWEGPVDRYDTTVECSNSTRIDFAPCEDNSFWFEREALTFISDVRVPYLRLQSEIDHVQPDNSHAINVVNAAVEGQPPWVRLNDYPLS